MFYLYIFIIAWLIMSSTCRHSEKFYANNTVGPVRTPYAFKHKNFEIIIPKRVDINSNHVSYAMKHGFKESNTVEDLNKDNVDDSGEKLHFLVPIKGENHHVELRPSRHIKSPGMIIETFKHPRKSQIHQQKAGKSRQCHFTGKIKGQRKSRAALSTCNGLSGYLQTGQGLFMIEPQFKNVDHSKNHPHPHVVYSRKNDKKQNSFCDTNDFGKKNVKEIDDERDEQETLRKRQVPSPEILHIETLVVLDQSFLHYHKDVDVENYVLTVFNIAHDLFHDSTLGVNINLAIVRLIRLEVEDHEMNIAMNHNIEKSMRYFRLWQKKINPKQDTHPNHHDMAVLLTRVDVCSHNKTCGFLGAARFGGMCDPENEAVIAQDSGLLVGYTIAHEIGHTLNLVHDGKPPEINLGDLEHLNDEIRSTVMSPHISDAIVEWSNCSHQRLRQFIDYGFGSCLFDAPTEHSFVMADELPGVMYDGDHQCRELFGPNAALCMTGVECDNLICYVEDKGCIETHTRPAQGTSCGENKWCFHGECLEAGERPNAVHGGWSDWSEWSECTRTCGSGVASQMRTCNNPAPKFGGQFCVGDSVRYKICTTEPCEPDTPSFRDVQCSEFNSWLYPGDGKVHQWKSYPMHDENPCALYCVSEDGNIASLRPRVIDGTTCYRGIRDICINGLCKEIPCDLDLQSTSVEDRCGVCKGDGTSCDIVRGEHAMHCVEMSELEERQIMTIPAGAVNVKIEEMLPSETRIQVRNKLGTNIYIDGQLLGMYHVHGSNAWVGMIRTKQEAISINGPLNETISIWANVQQNSTLRYTYGLPTKQKRHPVFNWDHLDWSSCSTECGPGVQTSFPKCVEKSSGLVDESFCKSIPRPKEQMRACEIAPCNPRWFVGDWSECSHCPSGTHTRLVKCYRPIGSGEGELDFIADNLCANNKPKTSDSCTCKKREKRDGSTNMTSTTVTSTANTNASIPSNATTSLDIYESTTCEPIAGNSSKSDVAAAGFNSSLVVVMDEIDEDNAFPTTTPSPFTTVSTPKVKTIVDFINFKHVKLTVHTELENDKYPKGLPHPKNTNDTRYVLQGKKALQFLNTLQHDFSNNKTKI